MMFDFSTDDLAKASLITQVAGGVHTGIGAFFSGQSKRSALRFQADMADINSRIDELGAQGELLKGERAVADLTRKAGALKGTQRASMAANGIDLGVGSAAEVQASTELMKENDKNTIMANAVRSAWGYRMASTNETAKGLIDNASADSISPLGMAGASLLGSAGTVAQSWYTYQTRNDTSAMLQALLGRKS